MKKNIYNWVWKWHFIAGLVSLPIVLILSITGIIYLFKDDYEKVQYEEVTKVKPTEEPISYQERWEIAQSLWDKTPDALIIKMNKEDATEFTSGMFSHKSRFLLDQYSGKEKGRIDLKKTDMHKVRKLHGELLLGSFGTKIVELVASWMVVLIITGIYLFLPRGRGIKGLFQIRTNQSKRIFFRDIHAITGFWFSALLLLILAGGLPWTDIFGSGYKWVQDSANSGFPATWSSRSLQSTQSGEPLQLDYFVKKAKELNLKGEVSVHLPQNTEGVYSISNQTTELSKMKMLHFDQYSGELIKSHTWNDIGLMMKTRLWVMAFHQGEFGLWNFILVLLTAFALLIMSLAGLISYFKRKPKGSWGVPNTPHDINFGIGLIALLIILGILLPLFGVSLIILTSLFFIRRKKTEPVS
ncbi:MAG: PepSY-associated TM helix domain-containing protein [Tamlana sp.]